ncbi:hypothetical protein Tco_0795357 [Tanacetum coccineum]
MSCLSLWKGVVRFGKKGKLAPRFVRPFEIVEKVGHVAYRLDLPEELNGVHDTFHVSNLKKFLADPTLQVPGMKRISDKRTKNQVKKDKTEHGMEKREKSKSTKVKGKAVNEEILNGPTRTHLMGRVSPLSQIMDKCKTGLGYNTIPPPYTGNFMPPKPDLVYLSLDDFVDVNESVSKSVVEKPTVETNEPKTTRKENRAPIIED